MAVTDTNNSQNLEITQGQTAQTWAGSALAEDDGTLGNLNTRSTTGGSASPYALTYATNSPDGWATQAGEDDSQYLTGPYTGSNATPMGGGNGPNTGPAALNNVGGTAQGWGQATQWQQTDAITASATNYSGTHDNTVASAVTPTISGGTSPYTVSALTEMPTGFSFSSSTGVISLSTSTSAGTYDLAFKVTDSAAPDGHEAEYSVTVTLS
jgi:hypothetical protein